MTKVTIDVDQKLLDDILAKLPWLSYDSATAFARDAVTRRFENLFALITN
jgi:hypothetical protein